MSGDIPFFCSRAYLFWREIVLDGSNIREWLDGLLGVLGEETENQCCKCQDYEEAMYCKM